MLGLSTTLTLLLIFCILSALTFEFINGFHDTANAVATVIYTNALKPGPAVIWSGLWNFIGVNIGGIAVAIGIVNLLPVQALTDMNIAHNLAMVMALIITAILWNIGTWYMGIPCSSSHALIGSITGVSLAYILLPGNHGITYNWTKVSEAGLSLIISPVIGFLSAIMLMFVFRKSIKSPSMFKEPSAKKAPPLWIRSLLIFSSTFVSFSHGSNDGQKGVGLMMIILIAIVPGRFSIDKSKDPAKLRQHVLVMKQLAEKIDTARLNSEEKTFYAEIQVNLDSLDHQTAADTGKKHPADARIRRDILLLAKHTSDFEKYEKSADSVSIKQEWMNSFKNEVRQIRTYTEYAPWWVIFVISVALGLGTTIGWKRIVVTIGEKIGKSHLNYAQGTVSNLIAAGTISVSSGMGLPVSTTHVLSSGIAGCMVSGKGLKNLQKKTVAAIGIAWIITIPVTILMAGLLFLFFRMIFS